MKKGEKALKYAALLWGDEKLRRITLEELCRSWNLNRLLQEEELSFRMRMRSTPVLPYNFGCRIRQAGIMERVLNAGGQENLNSCGYLPSSMKTLFSEKSFHILSPKDLPILSQKLLNPHTLLKLAVQKFQKLPVQSALFREYPLCRKVFYCCRIMNYFLIIILI